MKVCIIFILVVLTALHASAQLNTDVNLPDTWTKDFTITLSHSGSMDGSKSEIIFTYDSCKYKGNVGMKAPTRRAFLLSEADRVEIFKKLHEWKVDKIKSESSVVPVNDGWSQSICFGFHCIEGGTSAVLSTQDKDQFYSAYNYLEEFATRKRKR